MKITGKSAYRLLSMVLCICMVLSLLPALPLVAEAATVPTYIASIGVSQDGSSGSTGVNDCKRELAGHTIIDVDLNDEAGGDYVYMGYKTTTDPAQAITGILFRVGKNPPNSVSYGGSTFYLVGGSTEANTAQLGGYIDLNAKAGGYYIYTYVTRDPNYGAPLTNLTVNRSSSYSGWYAGTDTNGNVMDLNDHASNYYLYLHYQRFSGKASSTFYYLTSDGSRTSYTTSVSVKNHTQSVSTTPLMPSTVTYDGRTFTFRGWREDNTASSSTVSPSYSYMTSKTYRAVYSATVALSYNANGGSGAPSRQTATQYINAGSSSVSKTSHSFTISTTKPTHDDSKCIYLGWSTGSSATSASHQPGQTITISSNTTLYAVWRGEHTANRTYVNNGANHTYTWPCCGKSVTEAHSYTDGFCVCGAMIPDAVATVSKNGKVVAAYTILNDAIQAVQDCTAADEAVITILKGIALGDNYQTISSGVFTIDLNGFEISSTSSDYGALYVYGATVTIQDSGEDGKITGKRAGIEVFEGELTVLDGTVSGGSSRYNYGMYATSSTVTISGGSFSGYYGVYATGSSTVTISGGTISGESAGVYADRSNVNISSGSISSDTCGVNARNKSTLKISGGTVSSHDYGVCVYYSTVTVSDGIVSGDFRGVDAYYSTVTVSGGSISGNASGVYAYNASTVTISGGTVSGDDFGVDAYVSSTVTISGGTVSGVSCGVYACNKSTATLSGGSISGDQYDIRNINSTIALPLGEDGVGARFPGGITVLDTTLNEILGQGAAYWQGNTMILPADDATEITGGDVVIKSTCPHASKSNYTDLKDGASHTYFCSGCNNTLTESHSYTNGLCACGAMISDAVASVSKNGIVTGAYTTLNDAIQAVRNCTAADKAVVTILQDIALGDSYQKISSGVFTIDLNGHEISSTRSGWGALYISGSAPNVTIQGTGENSKITGNYAGIEMFGATLTVISGTISGSTYGVNASISTVTISGGTISGYNGVYAYTSTVTISGGTISGDWYGVFADGSNVTISGGSISSNAYDIACYSSTITLTVDEDGVGASFPGGIRVDETTLNAILDEGAAYWQGNTMILPANNVTEITGGDVVIKKLVYSGWTQVDGNWYYYDPDTNTPATGVTRVPYPDEAINGVTYAPNMEDVKYANDKGTLFKDSISAFFVFDENGVFQSGLNGMTSDNRWAVNGCIVWHVGLVQVGQDYYYFIGDVDNGGNKMATGDIYANRNTTDFDMVPGGVYTFGEDGKLCKNEGIVDLRYYENYRLMLGNGLTKVGENFIYVNSNGELIVDSEYYVPGNDLGIASGIYTFDENGFMIQPVTTDKDGVYFENGAWYYYESGEKQYGLGLIGVSKYWYYPDGTRFGTTATIYVRSNGQLATGEYYVTNVDNYDFGGVASDTKMIFSEEGMQYASKNGIYEIDGSLYYFVNNQIQYNAGLIELGGGWIYVRSNGQLAVGSYWITNTNGNLDAGMYEFGTDGYLVITDIEDGIVSENGVLYYYEDGKKQYGLGLRQLSDGSYIYVRTNGQLATGSYWITNHNGLLPEGMYTFGEDGILTSN